MTSVDIYNTLEDPGAFRILELNQTHPAETQLSGRLISSRLEDAPDYCAVSYVWGDQQPTSSILLEDGNSLPITKTLFNAIKELSSSHTSNRLWVDQICINQRDEVEKDVQISLMGTIYRQARQVLGWLGEPTEDSEIGIEFLSFLGNSERNPSFDSAPAFQELTEGIHGEDKLAYLFSPDGKHMKAADRLLQRPWFRRLWVVQEVLLSSSLQLRCGQRSIPGDIFFAATRLLASLLMFPHSPGFGQPYHNALRLTLLKDEIISTEFDSTFYPSLAHILSEWKCLKDEDRLNALWGIAFKDSLSTSIWFTPSCSISLRKLYESFAKAHIIQTHSLEILHFAGCGDSRALILQFSEDGLNINVSQLAVDIRSWAPDWRIKSRPVPFSPLLKREASDGFSATASRSDFNFGEEEGVLHVRALEVDRILCCGLPFSDELRTTFNSQDVIFHTWFELAKGVLLEKDAIEAMVASTLIVDRKIQPHYGTRYSMEPPNVISAFQQWSYTWLGIRTPEHITHREYNEIPADELEEPALYARWASEICHNRTFFVTKQGRCGLGSLHVRPGSGIYYIHGLKTPFVVQNASENGRHLLYGECFVYGLMESKVEWSEEDVYLTIS